MSDAETGPPGPSTSATSSSSASTLGPKRNIRSSCDGAFRAGAVPARGVAPSSVFRISFFFNTLQPTGR